MKSRRFLRYSLRTMLVVVLVLSVWLGWMANRASRQRRAVALVKELGGVVMYDYEPSPRRFNVKVGGDPMKLLTFPIHQQHPVEGPLYDLLGVDWFHDVELVIIFHSKVSDHQWGVIVDGIPEVIEIYLNGDFRTDATLEHLAALKRLELLSLAGTNVTDEGVARLRSRLPDLQVRIEP